MDAVITYVNGNDPVWKRDYEKYTDVPVMEKRFRDWGTLKYLLRGIETNMPFIRNVYLVVSHPSQVPDWADKENLHVVLHKDIIPEEYLPVFNGNPIEMHLHRIKGLDEEYIYFNDDMFPVRNCRAEDFFRDGKGIIGIYRQWLTTNMYSKICRNSDMVARKAMGLPGSRCYIRPQHICSPMLKSVCEEAYEKAVEDVLRTTACRIRIADNICQYLFLDYMYHKGLIINEKISNRHFSVAIASPASLKSFLLSPDTDFVCINDVHLSEKRYVALHDAIIAAFEEKFPQKSRFEL